MARLTGKRAVVTGGGTGIGRACAERLAQEGCRVAIAGRRKGPLEEVQRAIRAAGHVCTVAVLDVSSEPAVRETFGAIAKELSGIDILVNNAGVGGPNACATAGEDRWRTVLATNLDGMFFCTREALRVMPDGGRVINLSSVLGKFGVPGYTAYCTSKHGVIGFTKALALEVAPRRITVNALCPGWTDTEMARAGMEGIAQATGTSYEDAKKLALSQVPLGRMTTPAEVAGLVAWIASAEGANMTGQAINLCGGAAMW
jgi:NAD(P)-dependent dehydrogenase (short-subunit alcohol dehydrogenase family)